MIYLLLGLSVNEFSAIVIVCVDGLDFFQSHYCVFGGRYILRSWSIPSQVCLLLRFRKLLYFVSLFSWTLLSVLSITPFSVVVIFCVLDFLDSCFRSVDHSVFGSRYILCPWFLWLFFQVSLSLRFRQSLYFVYLISWTLLSGQSITPFSAVVIFCVLDLLDSCFRSVYHCLFGSRCILCRQPDVQRRLGHYTGRHSRTRLFHVPLLYRSSAAKQIQTEFPGKVIWRLLSLEECYVWQNQWISSLKMAYMGP